MFELPQLILPTRYPTIIGPLNWCEADGEKISCTMTTLFWNFPSTPLALIFVLATQSPIGAAFTHHCSLFQGSNTLKNTNTKTALFGISEWRVASAPGETTRSILLLPSSLEQSSGQATDEVPLVPGESKMLVLKEGGQMELLEEAMERHSSVIGGVLWENDSDEQILPVFPLCEITKYSLETASVTLKCVGRAKLLQAPNEHDSFLKGVCYELHDSNGVDTVDSECDDLVQDMEQILATAQNVQYQQAFWNALTALGYDPSSMLIGISQQELEAASWAGTACLTNPAQRYQAFAATTTLERLQTVRRSLLAQSMAKSAETSTQDGMDMFQDPDLGFFQ